MQGHLKEACFNINGYPEQYVELTKTKKETKPGKQVNLVEASTELENPMDQKGHEWMTDLIRQEVTKLLRENKKGKEGSVNFLTSDFAGMAINHSCTKEEKGI